MSKPGIGEDAKNLSIITVSAAIAVVLTAAFLITVAAGKHHEVRIHTHVVESAPDMGPTSANPRLYGTVTTRRGDTYTGFIRWDRNEGSWADLLDANKESRNGRVTQSSIRFGHVRRIDALGREEALFTLKSGEQVTLGARATDLGSGLRALLVGMPGKDAVEMDWGDLESVTFEAAPKGLTPAEGRLHGTLTTRSGHEFTGYVTWDVDEIYTTDVLDGDDGPTRRQIPFGTISSIERYSSNGARVTLRSGEATVFRGTNDVDDSNSGITVSDPGLGQVQIDWDELDAVRYWFPEPGEEPDYGVFDGGIPLRGTVRTEAGEEYRGEILWDDDESASWEMLNGEVDGIELDVEFSRIARIEKTWRGSLVALLDGRSFELSGSNDVEDGNRGITVRTEDGTIEIDWADFRELRLEH
jgi:hypothetical protein